MPEPMTGESESDFIARCIPAVLEDGAAADQEQAAAMCYGMFAAKSVVVPGGALKAEPVPDGLKVSGMLVRFGTPDDPDISPLRDYFTTRTDFDMSFPGRASVYYNHGLDEALKRRKLGDATLTMTPAGVWAETVLRERDEYETYLIELARAGKLGWSSGTAAHLVEREQVGEAHHVTRWPLGLDASLTPTPAEPRNAALPLKSLIAATAEAAVAAPADETKREANGGTTIMAEEINIAEIAKAAADEAVKAFAASLPPVKTAGYAGADAAVVKDAADQPWRSTGEFFQAVKAVALGAPEDARLRPLKASGLNEAIPSQGGYLLANGIGPGIIERMYEIGAVMGRVSRDQVGPNSNGMTYNALDETSRADGSRWGGVLGYWLAEAATKSASKPKFRQLDLKLKKVAAVCYATDELLEDATALGGWIARTVPEELRFRVEDAIVNGDGAGKPLGILQSPALVTVAKEAGQAAATFNYTNAVKMWSRMWAPSRRNAVWLVNQDVEPQIWQMALAVGTAGIPANFVTFGPDGSARIFGAPVLPVEYCQTLGTVGDVILADLSQYQAIEKGGVAAASSIHVQFLADETTYRFVYRYDGQPIWNSPLTPKNGTNTLSPSVVLATRA